MTRSAFLTPFLTVAAMVFATGSVMAFTPTADSAPALAKMLPGTAAHAVCAVNTARGPLGY